MISIWVGGMPIGSGWQNVLRLTRPSRDPHDARCRLARSCCLHLGFQLQQHVQSYRILSHCFIPTDYSSPNREARTKGKCSSCLLFRPFPPSPVSRETFHARLVFLPLIPDGSHRSFFSLVLRQGTFGLQSPLRFFECPGLDAVMEVSACVFSRACHPQLLSHSSSLASASILSPSSRPNPSSSRAPPPHHTSHPGNQPTPQTIAQHE